MLSAEISLTVLLAHSCYTSLFHVDLINLPEKLKNISDPELHKNWNILDHEDCGHSVSTRIIGGEDAELGEFPWAVLIGYHEEDSFEGATIKFNCDGSIISEYYILTALHCVQDSNDLPVLIRAGEYDLRSDIDCKGTLCAPPVQERKIVKILPYPAKSHDPPTQDIALLKLDRPLKFTEFVLPVCLPTKKVIDIRLTSLSAVIVGWGVKQLNPKKKSDVLQKLKRKIRFGLECELIFYWTEYENEWQLCAGGEDFKTACLGDSGGPLVTRLNLRGRPQYVLLGVVSYGEKTCGGTGYKMPTVFARVTSFLEWILDNITEK